MNEYKYIITIAEEKSLPKACEKLYISPSALCQYVSKLEERLGVKLFSRTKSGWIPTPAGTLYLSHAYDIVNTERNLLSQISSISDNEQESISIGLYPGFASHIISNVLPIFILKYPNVHLTITETTVKKVTEGVLDNTFDVGFIASWKNIEQIKLMDIELDQILVSVPSDSLVAKKYWVENASFRPFLPLSELKDMEFIVQAKGTTIREMQDIFFEKAGFEPSIVVETTNVDTSSALARSGYGVAILPSRYIRESDSVKVFSVDTSIRWHRYFATQLKKNLTPALEYLLQLIREAALKEV